MIGLAFNTRFGGAWPWANPRAGPDGGRNAAARHAGSAQTCKAAPEGGTASHAMLCASAYPSAAAHATRPCVVCAAAGAGTGNQPSSSGRPAVSARSGTRNAARCALMTAETRILAPRDMTGPPCCCRVMRIRPGRRAARQASNNSRVSRASLHKARQRRHQANLVTSRAAARLLGGGAAGQTPLLQSNIQVSSEDSRAVQVRAAPQV